MSDRRALTIHPALAALAPTVTKRPRLEVDPAVVQREREFLSLRAIHERWDALYRDEITFRGMAKANRRMAEGFLAGAATSPRFVEALSAHHIVEMGCGTGDLVALIRDTYDPGVLSGCDLSREAVRFAQKRFIQVNFWKHDVIHDPPWRSCDTIIAANLLEVLPDPTWATRRLLGSCERLILIGASCDCGSEPFESFEFLAPHRMTAVLLDTKGASCL